MSLKRVPEGYGQKPLDDESVEQQERNLAAEINDLSGSVVAHDHIIAWLCKTFVAAGAITKEQLRENLYNLETSAIDELPEEIKEGYQLTFVELYKNID